MKRLTTNRARTRTCLLGTLTALAVLLPGAAGAQEKITYLFPSLAVLPAFSPFQIAQHKGYYKAEGLEVEFQTGKGGVDVAKQVGAGNAQLGGGIADSVIIVRPNGVPVKAVALLGGHALVALASHADSAINGPADLKGKTVTTWALQDTNYYALLGALASAKLSKDDVNIQVVGPTNVWKFFAARQADAMVGVPDWLAAAEAAGAKIKIFPTDKFFPSMAQVIIASDEMIAKNPGMIRKFVKATLRGMKDVMDDPSKAAQDFVKAVPSNAERLPEMTRALSLYTSMVYSDQKVMGQMDAEKLAKLQDFYLEEKIIQSKVPVKDLYSDDFIR
ncbi:MAG: ABC transporter substrate-binding protein [Rhodospirillales bacterium]|nr:ABC transporter substrate-binding protein [Rhodospirillales bacterium]